MLTFLVAVAIAIVRTKDLFAVSMLAGIYGLLSASFFVAMDAVDVAFTEASVGAGISTLLMFVVITMTGRYEHPQRHKSLLAIIVVTITGGLLIYGTLDMPYFGMADAPIHSHVAPRYIENSEQEVGVINLVTAVLASYRAFDTLGEVVVIFAAGMGVIALLSVVRERIDDESIENINNWMHQQHLILRIVTKLLIPFILLFALYVQFHGDFGPGGGFQAGVIFASAMFLYALLFGLSAARRVINLNVFRLMSAIGILLYACVGVVSILNGNNFLDYNSLSSDPISGQHLGILLIELGVGCTVASVMVLIFFNFAGRQQDHENALKKENGQC